MKIKIILASIFVLLTGALSLSQINRNPVSAAGPITGPITGPIINPTETPAPTHKPASPSTHSEPSGSTSAPSCNDTKPTSAPKLISTISNKPNNVTLTWSKANDPVSYYLVVYGTNSAANQFGNPNVGGPATSSFTVEGLSGNITYFFRVRAGNGCAPGDFSNVLAVKANGKSILTPASGFKSGVLASKIALPNTEPTIEPTVQQTSSLVNSEPTNSNLFNRVLNFFRGFVVFWSN